MNRAAAIAALALGLACAGRLPVPWRDTVATVLHVQNFSDDSLEITLDVGAGFHPLAIVPPRTLDWAVIPGSALQHAVGFRIGISLPGARAPHDTSTVQPRQPGRVNVFLWYQPPSPTRPPPPRGPIS